MATLTQDRASIDWIVRLTDELTERSKAYKVYDNYYSGAQGLRFVATGYRELFTQAFAYYRENICKIVVDTVEQRLNVDGFRFPSRGSDTTDQDAWRIWQDNGLDARSQLAHQEAMMKGLSYALVSPFSKQRIGPGQRSPRIYIEKPDEAIVATEPGGTDRIVGLKTWFDAIAQRRYATLYFPDRIEKFQSTGRSWANQYASGVRDLGGWERRPVTNEVWPLKHDLGVVPLVPLVNHPRLGSGLWSGIEGESDIVDIVPIQDAINFDALNGIVASDKAAFPQKWATGIEIPKDPKTGKAAPDWQPDIADILSTRSPDAKFGNFDVAELANYDTAMRGKLIMVAIISQIPINRFIPSTGQPASGESREAAEIDLVAKAERRQTSFGEGWEEIVRLAFRQLGDDRSEDTACETDWRSASLDPAAAKIDAIVKERTGLIVPLEVGWRRAGYSATQREKFRAQIEAEREWLNSTPVKTTQPDAAPGPDAAPAPEPAPPVAGTG